MNVPNDLRDFMATQYRQEICARMGIVPFIHQAAWWAAADGLRLTDQVTIAGGGWQVRLPDDTTEWRVVLPRPHGRARVVADLGSFKIGKSFGSALWAAGFAIIPGRRVKLVGLEYDTCAPEFDYLAEFLLSDRGMCFDKGKPPSYQNRPKDGRMYMELSNGTRFEARSWERKDGLKGKEDDAYIMCEAYQLPGLECYTDFKQNLDRRAGYAVFPTTPDRPWVKILHEHGHDDPEFPDWQCVCGIGREVNPYTYNAASKEKDRKLMTREKFAIHYEGKLGEFVGSVFGYQRGERTFTTRTHPHLWHDPEQPPSLQNFRLPHHWEVIGAGDTGTFTAGLLAAYDERGDLFFFYEQPNYRYVSGKHEWETDTAVSTIPGWATTMRTRMAQYRVRGLWADKNSQFKREFQNYDLQLFGADTALETRTNILREYFQHKKVWLAPWLEVLPYEIERAQWPDESTRAGKFERIKKQDHTLDGAEHIAARRPLSQPEQTALPRTFIEEYLGRPVSQARRPHDPHLGVQ